MQGTYLRKYGVEAKVDFVLFEVDGVDFRVDAAHAAGDTKIMKDEGAEANTANGFVDEGQGYSITISATEMEAARIVIYIVDSATKVWLDTALVIETYGNASAMHAFDLDTATVNLSSTTETQIDAIETDTNELQGLISASKIAAQVKGTDDIDLSATQKASVNAEADTALSDYDSPTKAEMDTAHALLATVAALTTVDTVVDAIKAKTDNLPTDPADDSDIDAQLATIDGNVDTLIARLTALRAGYLDNLSAGAVALASVCTEARLAELAAANLPTDITTIDTVVDAIKAKTDNLPADPADDSDIDAQLATIAGYLDTEIAAILAAVDTEVAAILADTGTDGVVLSTATKQAIADEILKRSVSNVEDVAGDHTLAALILAILEWALSGSTLTIKKTDGSTAFLTKTVTSDAAADPITGVA